MGKTTEISWCDHTFNPWWGCTKVSPACDNCYAEAWAGRQNQNVWGQYAPRRFFGDKHWEEPLAWNRAAKKAGKPAKVFCASMGDVFEDRRDLDESRHELWSLIDRTPWLTWLLLTKRPENYQLMAPPLWLRRGGTPRNVWVGVTAEDQAHWSKRVSALCNIQAIRLFVSCEPLLGPIECFGNSGRRPDWVIVGGESQMRKPGSVDYSEPRPMKLDWVRNIREQCVLVGVPFHFKSWGDYIPSSQMATNMLATHMHQWQDRTISYNVGKRRSGDLLDGKQYKQFPIDER